MSFSFCNQNICQQKRKKESNGRQLPTFFLSEEKKEYTSFFKKGGLKKGKRKMWESNEYSSFL
jgi:hypothetical protein